MVSVALLLLSVAVLIALLVLRSRSHSRSAMPAPKITSKIPVKSVLPQPSKTVRTTWPKKPDKTAAEEKPAEIELRLDESNPPVKRAVSKEKLSRTDSRDKQKTGADPKNGDKSRPIPAKNVSASDKTKRVFAAAPSDNGNRSARTNPDVKVIVVKNERCLVKPTAVNKPRVSVIGKSDDSENKSGPNKNSDWEKLCDVSSLSMRMQQHRSSTASPRVMCRDIPGAVNNNIAAPQITDEMPDSAWLGVPSEVTLRTEPQLVNRILNIVELEKMPAIESFNDETFPVVVSSYLMPNGKHRLRPSGNFSNEPKALPIVTFKSTSIPKVFDCLTLVSGIEKTCGLFFGAFCVSTGKQISDRRFRTECQIFFRAGVLPRLESQRDEKLADRVIRFQAHCRGYLARKRFAKRKVEQLAVRCIQRNVRKFLSVRDWPWWRLLVRVTPLLNVHRTEEELRLKTEELDNLKSKFEKLEQEKSMLKLETSKLEAKLSELTMDLAEEHSSAALANQRLKMESAEKMRLEKELDDIQKQKQQLMESSERLEMELLYSRSSEMNGSLEGEGDDESAYKQRYERAARELAFSRRRLQQQHQDDLEQLVALKKQFEKKLSDAYEEVEEQRQVVSQWKRKNQKLTSEMNDLRLLLEKQNSRNDMLEKKQRKFDTEIQLLTDELRQEKTNKDRALREKEMALADKYTMEQNLSGVKLELELKEQKVNSLTAELNELTFGGSTEEDVGLLKKAKHQLQNKVKEQEEELDDLAGQVQLLEQAKLRLEMTVEQIRKENKKELAQRDEELEEVRCNAHKKVKALECQLENEHEERTLLLRERHDMDRKLAEFEETIHSSRSSDQEQLQKLRRDLKRTKALLRDAQATIEQSRTDTPNKALIRQLRNQLEDAECARSLAVKAKQAAEADRSEAVAALEDATKARAEAEDRASALLRERSQLQSQLDENEEELADVLKKYRATVQQLSQEQVSLQEQASRIAELETERTSLREQLAELSTRVESMETMNDPNSSLAVKRLQLKTKELESKLELEQTTRSRLQVQITRLKENNERLQNDIEAMKAREHSAQEKVKLCNRQLRELREEYTILTSREQEAQAKMRELEKSVDTAESDATAARSDLRLALQRIEDLQCAIQGDMEDADDNSGASSDSDSSVRSDEVMTACSLTLADSGDSSYQSVDRSGSRLRRLNEPFAKDSSLA